MVYTFALFLSLIALSPYFIYRAIRHKKYLSSLKQRLGWSGRVEPTNQPTVWIHSVSVGETLAIQPLVQRLSEGSVSYRLVVSTTTETGQALARRRFLESAEVIYFPLDFEFSVQRALEAITPSLVLVVETEIWPIFLRACHRRQLPVVLINGRISDRSFKGYYVVRRYLAHVLSHFRLLLMQSQRDAVRILQLGARPDRVAVTGNLKYDFTVPDLTTKVAELDQVLDITNSRLIVAGSTARNEEKLLLDAFAVLARRPEASQVRLLLAPRHPERFDEVESLIAQTGLSFVRRSQAKDTSNGRCCKVILLDTLGELAAVYAAAEIVFVGGSLVPVGGHNILEPALFGKPILVGPYTSNFQPIVDEFIQEDALIQLEPAAARDCEDRLVETLRSLVNDPTRRQKLGQNARTLLERNRGATDRTLEYIARFLPPSPSRREREV